MSKKGSKHSRKKKWKKDLTSSWSRKAHKSLKIDAELPKHFGQFKGIDY
jgi:hypothetical protein